MYMYTQTFPLSRYFSGYEQFHLFCSDPALCFKAMVGEETLGGPHKKKKTKMSSGKGKGGDDEEEEEEEELDLSGDDSDGESSPSTPGGLSIQLTNYRKCVAIKLI